MKRQARTAHLRRIAQSGVALLEAMVAVLIFSLGVLGLIAILAGSIRATNDARYRAEAALAQALLGAMWSTRAADLDTEFGAGGPQLVAGRHRSRISFRRSAATCPSST